ncbi:MAG: type II toxin-antitoxin system RelE/ParE family toxin [Parafilimonas sp.]
MAKYRFTNKAVEDLSAIWNYSFEKWSENQADKYYEMLLNCCQQVADNSSFGKKYEQIINDLLGFKAGRHIIFYHVISKTKIEIIRILHERMDLKNRVRE